MSIVPISMSQISDPPKIDYTIAKNEDKYYKTHAGCNVNLARTVRNVQRSIARLLQLIGSKTPNPLLKSNRSPL